MSHVAGPLFGIFLSEAESMESVWLQFLTTGSPDTDRLAVNGKVG